MPTTFSLRTARDDAPNALFVALDRARAAGERLLDLTTSNPTTAGIPHDASAILAAIADPRSLVYAPEPLGLPSAREAAAATFASHGATVDPSRVALTASTSEAYAVLFKVLCDPGDEILVPAPSYPLLGFLAEFESVALRTYPLVHAGRWHVDLEALRAAISPRTKAIVVVSPNNPTGSYLGEEELERMLDLDLPIVSDEVFATYPMSERVPEGRVATVAGATRGLVFALSGLSKLAALPQMKLGWIGVSGAEDLAARAMRRLELVLDAYLSVGTPVQHALPAILSSRAAAEDAIRARARENLRALRAIMKEAPSASVLDVEGGWYAIVRVPDMKTDERWALDLAVRDHVAVQPGYFFDMDRGAHLVVSLLTPEPVFAEGAARLAARVREDA
ncbi:MAG: pyridoxal phosphate-dependent aminotransferase [Labilithrix sp.]|nr:pyridoxal phosphate-dependent aminotransferase [Labilithrix sp.]